MKKFVAEFIGTCVLVTLGCGTAMLTGCEHWGGYLATALAFGLVIVGMDTSVHSASVLWQVQAYLQPSLVSAESTI